MSLRETILARLQLAERDEESIPLGCTLRLRELTRAQLRDCQQWAATSDLAERERTRGIHLASAVQGALEHPETAADATRQALVTFWLGASETVLNVDRWHAALVAVGTHDPATGEALFSRDDILAWPDRNALWDELARLARLVLNISEVGDAPLKSGDPAPAAE